jgi:hypothetical protein
MSYLRYLCLFAYSGVQHILCYVFLRLVCPMLPVSLDCFCYVFLRLVYPMLPVSLDCFCYVFLRLVYPMLPVSLDCEHGSGKQKWTIQRNWKHRVHKT